MNSPQTLSPSAFYQTQISRLLAYQQAIDAELAKRNLQDLPLEKLLRLSDLLSRQLQRLLKAAAPVSTQINPDQASLVEVRFQRAGDGGFQPPVPAESASTQIKGIQANSSQFKAEKTSTQPVGTNFTPSPASSATSDVEVAILAAGQSGFQPPVPSETASTPIKANQAFDAIATPDAPSSEFKVQSSAFKVPGSGPSTLNSPLSTVLEHCLMCGAPLPPLLPNGQRPDYYCKCGSPIHCAPGTSLLERCPHCGELQRAHGYNATRQDNRCCKCGQDLPPLDPKSRYPWLPPARPQTPTPK